MQKTDALISLNAERWRAAKVTRAGFDSVAQRLFASRERYRAVSRKTGVPWFIISVIHEREASGNWNTQLGQGDPLDRVSTHVPKGRGPFKTWEDGACDALMDCPPHAADWNDWTTGGALTLLESYNGLGYATRGLPSPYVWSGTDQYVKGKYVSDGVFNPDVVDIQLGCAGLLMAMRKLDSTILFADESAPPPDVPKPEPKPVPQSVPQSRVSSFWGVVSAAFQFISSLIFKNRK